MEDCTANRTNLGVAMHNASSLALRGCHFFHCVDGAMLAGNETNRISLEVSNNTFHANPDLELEIGYVWFDEKVTTENTPTLNPEQNVIS